MPRFYSRDPEQYWQDTQKEIDNQIKNHPVCEICHEHILDDTAYRIGDHFFHEDCFTREYRVDIEDYLD